MKIRILSVAAISLALSLASCSKIESFHFKTPDQPGDSIPATQIDTSTVIRSLTITRYDSGKNLIDSATRYFFYDTLYGVVAISTTPITDTTQPFTGYIYLYENQYKELTRVTGRYRTNPDSINYLTMTYNYDAQGLLISAVRMNKDGSQSTLTPTIYPYGNGISYLSYPDDTPSTSNNFHYGITRLTDGSVSSVDTHNADWSYNSFDTNYVSNVTHQESPIMRSTTPYHPGAYQAVNVTAVNQNNSQLHDFHRALFFGIEFFPGAFFSDQLSPEIASEFQPWLPVTTDVSVPTAPDAVSTVTFHHNPVLDSRNRLVSADFYSIVDNAVCTQHWRITYY